MAGNGYLDDVAVEEVKEFDGISTTCAPLTGVAADNAQKLSDESIEQLRTASDSFKGG